MKDVASLAGAAMSVAEACGLIFSVLLSTTVTKFVERNSGVPLYRQIKKILVDEIRSDDQSPLMTEQELIRRFRVSRAPIRQALQELADEGIVYRERAKGTFPVRRPTVERPATLKFGGLVGYLTEQGLKPVNRVSGVERMSPPLEVATALRLGPGDRVLTFLRSVIVKGRPLSSARIYINSPEEFTPTAAALEASGSAIALLEEQFGIVLPLSEHHVRAELAGEADAAELEVEAGSAILVLETVAFTREGPPALWRRAIQPAGEFTYIFTSTSPSD
jgi:GntR family transcriptional regulator